MICPACKLAADNRTPEIHDRCVGSTWCDCQHVVKAAPSAAFTEALMRADAAAVLDDDIDFPERDTDAPPQAIAPVPPC